MFVFKKYTFAFYLFVVIIISMSLSFSFAESALHNVDHQFVSDSNDYVLPAEISNRVQGKHFLAKQGEDITPNNSIDVGNYVDIVNNGVWKFKGWKIYNTDVDIFEMINEDITFVGYWHFYKNSPENAEFNVNYKFISDVPNVDIPIAIEKRLMNKNRSGIKNFSLVTVDNTIDLSQYYDKVNHALWEFDGWIIPNNGGVTTQPITLTVENEEILFIGMWGFGNHSYEVAHSFESLDKSIPLPKALVDRLKNTNLYIETDSYATPNTKIDLSNLNDSIRGGVWKFKKWQIEGIDADEILITDFDVDFKGIWEFVPNPPLNQTFKATHIFTSGVRGEDIPEELKKRLNNTDILNLHANDTVIPNKNIDTSIFYDNIKGIYWSFDGWLLPEGGYSKSIHKTVENADIVFSGNWYYIPNGFTLSLSFVSDDNTLNLPPEVNAKLSETFVANLYKTEVVHLSSLNIDTNDYFDSNLNGRWRFSGWVLDESPILSNLTSVDVNNQNHYLKGVWSFAPNSNFSHAFKNSELFHVNSNLPSQYLKNLEKNSNLFRLTKITDSEILNVSNNLKNIFNAESVALNKSNSNKKFISFEIILKSKKKINVNIPFLKIVSYPKTGDSIHKYIFFFAIGLVSLVLLYVHKKKTLILK